MLQVTKGPVDPDAFKAAGAALAAAVTIVTARVGEELHGCTATAVSTLSLVPPMVLVCLDRSSRTLPRLLEAGHFTVNVMGSSPQAIELSRHFASKAVDKFSGVSLRPETTGSPVVEGVLAWFDCELTRVVEGGDHAILLGAVKTTGAGNGEPLLYWNGDFRRLAE